MTVFRPNIKCPKKWGILILIVSLILVVLYVFFRSKDAPPEHITAEAVIGDITENVMASGTIKAITSVNIGSQVGGEIINLYVNTGDNVNTGDKIAQIDQITQQNNLQNAQATLDQAQSGLNSAYANLSSRQSDVENATATVALRKAELAKAHANHERFSSLIAIDAISRQEYENSMANVELAKANLVGANSALNSAKNGVSQAVADIQNQQSVIIRASNDLSIAQKDLSYTTITAPMSGTIISLATEKGATVNANQSTPTIATLADLSRVRINTQISEADIINLKVGMPARFNIIGDPDQKFDAILSGIEPAPQTTSGSDAVYYLGYLEVDNRDGKLRLGMTTQVDIIVNEAKNVLTVPSSALHKQDAKDVVQILSSDGTVVSKEVKVGLNNRVIAEIKSGLNAGDKVIISDSNGKNHHQPW